MGTTEKGRKLKRIADLALFARIVQVGGITRCAQLLGIERTTVSRRLKELEQEFGVKLLHRTPKHTFVTEAGKRCFEKCEVLWEVARLAEQAATIGESAPNLEPLAIAVPPDILDVYLGAKIQEFQDLHPNVQVDQYPVTNATEEVFNIAVLAITWNKLTGPNTLSQRVTGVRQSLYASPRYVELYGHPKSPYDLDDHRCIVDISQTYSKVIWMFYTGGDTIRKSINLQFAVSDLLQAREATLAGCGVGRLPDYLAAENVESGRLVRLMDELDVVDRDLYIVTPTPESTQPRATSLRLFLEEALAQDWFEEANLDQAVAQ